jgi:preprotein translocase subunit SecE
MTMAKTPVSFLKEVQDELKKVVWPTRTEVIRLTFVVVFISLVVGVFLGGIDMILVRLIEIFINR